MTKIEANKAGVAAYQAGNGRAPALNAEFTKAACDSAKQASSKLRVSDLLGEYTHGWTIAMLADGAIEGAPSIAELARITQQ